MSAQRATEAMFDHKEYIASLPRRPGVYRMYGAGQELLYVGKARSLRDRVATYFAPRTSIPRYRRWWARSTPSK